jgi:hypothetical protein
MRRTARRVLVWALVVLTNGMVFDAASCYSFKSDTVLSSVNWCYVIDCQNGLFGGLIQPCGSPLLGTDDLLQDCPSPVFTATDTTQE